MSEWRRVRLAIKYIFIETIPTFIMGVVIFLFILLIFCFINMMTQNYSGAMPIPN